MSQAALLVSALNESEITSHVVSPVISVDYNYQRAGPAKAFSIGLVAARNVADATVSASIDGVVDLDAGSVTVEASQKGKIHATAAAAAVSVAVGRESAQSISGAGVVAFNTILGDVKAVILDSDVSAPSGEVSVKAENTADIDATTAAAAGSVSAGFTGGGNAFAIGLALAFNHIGFAGSAATPGPATALKTEAAIRNSGVTGNKVSVKASSDATIDARSLVASVAVGASKRGGWSAAAGGVSAVNKIATATTAVIEETETDGAETSIDAGAGGLSVSAENLSDILSTVAGVAVAANFSAKGSGGVGIGVSVAINEIDSDVSALVSDVGVESVGAVSVDAKRGGSIKSDTVAAAVAAGIAPGGGGRSAAGAGAVALNDIKGSIVADVSDSTIGTEDEKVASLSVKADDVALIDALVGAVSAQITVGSQTSAGFALGGSGGRQQDRQ